MADKALQRLVGLLKKMDAEAAKRLKGVQKGTAKTVAKLGKARAKSEGSTLGKAASAIRAGMAANPRVIMGGPRWPYALGAELGSKQGPHKKQFREWRGNPPKNPFEGSAGYGLYPAIRDNEGLIKHEWGNATARWLRETWPNRI